ncbi:MAG: hypothetical protein LH660_07740 [Phormidesmis sp. CAN_BIN36]|nr:hypothetical protein [Phormidesmis sp. CAN_BIN36]
MPIIRLILLLGIAATLLLFALQNWTPSMQLVFLGIRSPAFPLALWVLGAIAAGILTTLMIAGLFRLTGFSAQRQRGRRPASVAQNASDRYTYQAPGEKPSQSRTTSAATRDENGSDWEDDASDWFYDETDDRPKSWESGTQRRGSDEAQQETRSDSGAKPESVVDADFRVIVPPYRNLDQDSTDDEK